MAITAELQRMLDYFGKIANGNNTYIVETAVITPGVQRGNNCMVVAVIGYINNTYLGMKNFNILNKNVNLREKRFFLNLDEEKICKKTSIK